MNLRIYTLLAITISVSGCANKNTIPNDVSENAAPSNETHYEVIANNMMNVLAQLDTFRPLTTTVNMKAPRNEFGMEIIGVLEKKGYGIKIVSEDIGDSYVSYRQVSTDNEYREYNAYQISIGETSVEREYVVKNGFLEPATPITLNALGSDQALEVEVDDTIFDSLDDPAISRIILSNEKRWEEIPDSDRKIVEIRQSGDENIFDRGHSNFSSVFENYADLEEQILVFGNDSLVLGKINKGKIRKLANSINPETDVVSIIGCSHGRSNLDNGNQLLAEGRAHRVKEAFIFAGVEPDVILEEACWAGEYWDEMVPRRGVVVSHKRILDQG